MHGGKICGACDKGYGLVATTGLCKKCDGDNEYNDKVRTGALTATQTYLPGGRKPDRNRSVQVLLS